MRQSTGIRLNNGNCFQDIFMLLSILTILKKPECNSTRNHYLFVKGKVMKMKLPIDRKRDSGATVLAAIVAAAFIGLSGCEATMPKMGG
ncbi:MAG: hypothetical protein B6D72_18860, partial [gamma proteobacterium symbiont of Ctena orbiculata]